MLGTIHSGGYVLVVVNVHFEPDLTWRSLRERLRLVSPHCPCYPGALGGLLLVTSTSVNPRKEESTSGLRLSRMVMRRRLPCSGPFFRTSLKSHSLTSQGKISQPVVQYVLCPELTEHLLIFRWLRIVISTASLTYRN